MNPGTFAAVMAAAYVGHQVGDHWVQTHRQATTKHLPGWAGRWPCIRHVAGLTAAKAVAVGLVALACGIALAPAALVAAAAVDVASHYAADRRTPLRRVAYRLGKGEFWHFGEPAPGSGGSPHLGTGAYALDQTWHLAWLLMAALIATTGATP